MKTTRCILTALLCAMMLTMVVNMADARGNEPGPEQIRLQEQEQLREQERLRYQEVYGWQLMTPEEQAEHRNRMRSFATEQEREAYRSQHHKEMQERAREKGVTLPEMESPTDGSTFDRTMPGKGYGGGRGPGGGRQK